MCTGRYWVNLSFRNSIIVIPNTELEDGNPQSSEGWGKLPADAKCKMVLIYSENSLNQKKIMIKCNMFIHPTIILVMLPLLINTHMTELLLIFSAWCMLPGGPM